MMRYVDWVVSTLFTVVNSISDKFFSSSSQNSTCPIPDYTPVSQCPSIYQDLLNLCFNWTDGSEEAVDSCMQACGNCCPSDLFRHFLKAAQTFVDCGQPIPPASKHQDSNGIVLVVVGSVALAASFVFLYKCLQDQRPRKIIRRLWEMFEGASIILLSFGVKSLAGSLSAGLTGAGGVAILAMGETLIYRKDLYRPDGQRLIINNDEQLCPPEIKFGNPCRIC